MKAEDIRLSYTDPITGVRAPRDAGRQYVEVDGVLLVVTHVYRSRGFPDWSAEAYTDHLESRAHLEWAKGGNAFGFAHIRRRDLLAQIAAYTEIKDWAEKRAAWLAVPRNRWKPTRRYTIERRGVGDWWAAPRFPERDRERGPYLSEETARADLGDSAN
ncbi:hypothetical protein C6N75_15235 [Streptomyces solincola]|uniref:Uncharacterized protein n=1 Tax=Streptomyces solincola TaxID=2100817 RepID=A0A2S9PVC8_9ACTN|nr:hypothetical protein [Streptomyces solincola]PRH78386.1 hypothetical protein C6N75_15235 [Streptomyces solincola]